MHAPRSPSRAAAVVCGALLLLATSASVAAAQAPVRDPARATAIVDSIVGAAIANGRAAGASVAVVRGRDTLVMRGYGRADLEFDVPTPARAVYEIGSVTKQFTAAAILQLVEQGKLSLDDEVTRHLPTYPTQGHRVTVRRLMDHTSGIRSYTEIPEFGALAPRTLPRDSLIALFASRPFDFAPGTGAVYNNSAYFLLGRIIEQASGMSYADYVQRHLFARAGMPDSRYCDHAAVIPRRARGYALGRTGLQRADHIDHAWPYAAGSLCSTTSDLVAWTQALHGGRILGDAAYRELVAPGTLADGTRLRYAKGLYVNDSIAGHAAVHHGGDIPGFASHLAWLPAESTVVVVLVNTGGPVRPEALTQSIVGALFGDRTPKPLAFRGRAADYAGEYRGVGRGRPQALVIAPDSAGTGLVLRVNGTLAQPLAYLGGETWGRGAARYTFVREGGARGRVTALRADTRTVYALAARVPAATPATGGGTR